jgi:hypothetical protein
LAVLLEWLYMVFATAELLPQTRCEQEWLAMVGQGVSNIPFPDKAIRLLQVALSTFD